MLTGIAMNRWLLPGVEGLHSALAELGVVLLAGDLLDSGIWADRLAPYGRWRPMLIGSRSLDRSSGKLSGNSTPKC